MAAVLAGHSDHKLVLHDAFTVFVRHFSYFSPRILVRSQSQQHVRMTCSLDCLELLWILLLKDFD